MTVRGAARAIGWEFGRHHRLGLAALGVYFAFFWIAKRWLLAPEAVIRLDPPNGLAGALIAPLTITYFFFVGVFSYGLAGDLAARESAFPRRMFTLPASTLALAGWPMLYGTLASAGLWIMAMLFVRSLGGLQIDLPWIWPALLMATFLAWMQALTWMGYPLRGLRVVVAVALLTSVDAIVVLAIAFRAHETTMIAMLLPLLAAAYLAGIHAVGRARRGDLPQWRLERLGVGAARGKRREFTSAARAQTWLEWRRHGRTLPALVGMVIAAELGLLFLPGPTTGSTVFMILVVALITPPVMAMVAAPALSGFTTYAATRPVTTFALVGAKLKVTMWSTLAAWLLALVLIVCALGLSDTAPFVVERMRALVEIAGPLRAAIIVIAVLAALVASTWKNLVQSLCIGLTGRAWLVKSSVLVALVALVAAFPLLYAITWDEKLQSFVWDQLPWIVVGLVWLKIAAASWVAIRLHARRVLTERALVMSAAGWLAAVVIVYGLLWWMAASPIYPFWLLGGLAILAVPLARLAAAPLALDSSRHR